MELSCQESPLEKVSMLVIIYKTLPFMYPAALPFGVLLVLIKLIPQRTAKQAAVVM